jgi:hypothetical protein
LAEFHSDRLARLTVMIEFDELELPAAGDPIRAALLPMIEHIFAVTSDGSPQRAAAMNVALEAVERIGAALMPKPTVN